MSRLGVLRHEKRLKQVYGHYLLDNATVIYEIPQNKLPIDRRF